MELGSLGSIFGGLILLSLLIWGIFLMARHSGINPRLQVALIIFFPWFIILYALYWGVHRLLNLLRGTMRSRIAEPRATSDEKRQCPDANPK